MTWLLPLLLLLIFAAAVGFLYPEGMWSNAVRLINVVTAALLATKVVATESRSPVALPLASRPTHAHFGPHPPMVIRATAASSLRNPNSREFCGARTALHGSAAGAARWFETRR